MSNTINKIILVIVIVVFISTLIPLLWISFYNHPQADDFSTSVETYHAYSQSGSIIKTLKAAALRTYDSYMTWHGGYASIFLTTLQPNIFSENFYTATAFIMLFALILSTMFFLKKLLIDILKLDKTSYYIIALIILIISIQFPPKTVSAFYWFNGAVMYTLAFSFLLVLFGTIINVIISENKRVIITNTIISLILSIIIAGGNAGMSFIAAIYLFCIFLFLLLKNRKKLATLSPVFITYVVCLFINLCAPGNAVRQSLLNLMNPISAIIQALFSGTAYFTNIGINSIAPALSIFCFVFAIIPFASKIIKNPSFKFRYPILVLIFTYCLFCAQFAPAIYALTWLGPWRIRNIYFFTFIYYILFNTIYISGWAYRKLKELNNNKPIAITKFLGSKHSNVIASWFFGMIFIGCFLFVNDISSVKNISSVSALRSLVYGEAKSYHEQYNKRIDLLNSSEEIIVFEPFEKKPYILFFDDLRSNPDDWQNIGVAEYYGKTSVRINE